MLYVYHGNDVVNVRKKAHEFLRTYEEAGSGVREVSTETYSPGMLTDLAGAVSLFLGTEVTLIDTLSEDTGAFDSLREVIPLLAESQNIFVVIETTLSPGDKKLFTQYAAKIEETKGTSETMNPFALADALTRRDKKSLWILLTEAWRNGLTTEAIIGTLYWQMKLLRLAERTKNATEAGQKDFPYNKAKRALGKFKKGEVDSLSRELLALYHEGHTGKRDIDLALERWVLTL